MEQFLARQPIFDVDEQVVAFELLYQQHEEDVASGESQGEMTAELIVSFLESGPEQVSDGSRALIAISEDMLRDRITKLLPFERVILQVSSGLDGDADVVDACGELAAAGYPIAVDGFRPTSDLAPLLELATYAKVDTRTVSGPELQAAASAAGGRGCRPIATHVDTLRVWEQCRAAGFELFQGHFFRDPELLTTRESPVAAMNVLRLLNVVRDPGNSDVDLEEIFKADPKLTFELLRIVNSAAMGGRGIDSIGHAIQLLGRQTLYRWLSVLMVSALPMERDSDWERATTALLRARFLESLGSPSSGELHEGHLFLTGLFSVIDALLGIPIAEAVTAAALPDSVRLAVLERDGPCGDALKLIEAYEAGDWPAVSEIQSRLPLGSSDLSSAYREAVSWSRKQMAA